MDQINYRILNLLQADSRITYTQISKEVNLSIPSVRERIECMIDKGIIKRSTIEIDYKKLGKFIEAIVSVDVKQRPYEHFKEFCKNSSHILTFYRVVGTYNAIIYVAIEDMKEFEKFIDKIKEYGNCQSSIITSTYFKNKSFKLGIWNNYNP